MRALVSLLATACVTFGAASVAAGAAALPQEKQEKPAKPVYDEAADASADIAAALARAKRQNRRVLVQWGANWCGWCVKLHGLCGKDETIRKELLYEYDVVRVDVGQFDKHMDVADRYGAELKKNGIPFLTVLDADGKVLANQETSSLEADGAHDPKKVLAFLTQHQAPQWKADELYQGALKRAGDEQKNVLVLFGAPWCGWCHRFEDWRARPEIAALLAKGLVTADIDSERTVGGAGLMKRLQNGRSGGLPWFAIVDPKGSELASSNDAKGENIGCPNSDEEIEWFLDMLRKGAPVLSVEELSTLQKSLVANRVKQG